MKITKVEPQATTTRKGFKRFNIYLNGEFAFGADEDLVVNRRLVVGKEIERQDLEQILFEAEVGKLMEKMYRLFGIRQRSEREVREYLKVKNFKLKVKSGKAMSQLVIDALIEKLRAKQMINDEEFARAWVEARRRSKKLGIKALKQELFQKGIDRELAERIMNNELSFNSEEQIAEQALERKIRAWGNLEPLDFKKKAFGFLARKGFEFDVIQKLVEKTLKEW